jgi:hypothetical protein
MSYAFVEVKRFFQYVVWCIKCARIDYLIICHEFYVALQAVLKPCKYVNNSSKQVGILVVLIKFGNLFYY